MASQRLNKNKSMKAESRISLKVLFLSASTALFYGVLLYILIPHINEQLQDKKLINIILVSSLSLPILLSWGIYNKTIKKWKSIDNNFKLESSTTITMIFFFFSSIALVTAIAYAK